jgi:hypothetical protein
LLGIFGVSGAILAEIWADHEVVVGFPEHKSKKFGEGNYISHRRILAFVIELLELAVNLKFLIILVTAVLTILYLNSLYIAVFKTFQALTW